MKEQHFLECDDYSNSEKFHEDFENVFIVDLDASYFRLY
jgi:hypothetical protein